MTPAEQGIYAAAFPSEAETNRKPRKLRQRGPGPVSIANAERDAAHIYQTCKATRLALQDAAYNAGSVVRDYLQAYNDPGRTTSPESALEGFSRALRSYRVAQAERAAFKKSGAYRLLSPTWRNYIDLFC